LGGAALGTDDRRQQRGGQRRGATIPAGQALSRPAGTSEPDARGRGGCRALRRCRHRRRPAPPGAAGSGRRPVIPIGDRLRTRTVPWINYALIAVNFIAFFYELTLSTRPQAEIVRGFVRV